MMLKEMMNTRQAVKSVEGYNTLSRRRGIWVADLLDIRPNAAVDSIVFPASRGMV